MPSFPNPISQRVQSNVRESSSQRSIRDSDSGPKMWIKLSLLIKNVGNLSSSVASLQIQVAKIKRRVVGGGGGVSGWFWTDGKKLYGDPTANSYTKNQIVKILESDAIVTTGIVCAGSATAVKATPGKWVCLKNVPTLSATEPTGNNPAYIPAIPAVSGSLDPDNAGNYWEFLTPSSICVNGATITI